MIENANMTFCRRVPVPHLAVWALVRGLRGRPAAHRRRRAYLHVLRPAQRVLEPTAGKGLRQVRLLLVLDSVILAEL